MTNLRALFPSDPVLAPSGQTQINGVLETLTPFVVAAGLVVMALGHWLQELEHSAEEKHLRSERLAAYRTRHGWKTSDIRPLLSIGVNETAQRRIAGLKGKGRPVVHPHRKLDDWLYDRFRWLAMFCDDAAPSERRRSFKLSPWWKHHVEALYRGELERARANQIRGAYDHAERVVAAALRISPGAVHAICGEIRAMRLEDAEAANFPPMVLTDYERWMEHGELPERLAVL